MSQSYISEEKVFEEIKKAVVETLSVDESSIKPESSFINDLEAESLDFLDINYRLEQAFGMKMARHFVLEHIEEMFGEGTAIDENGQLTEKAIELLKIRFTDEGSGDASALKAGMDMDKCSNCGNSAWQSDNEVRIKCGSCGEYAAFTNGDDLIKEWLEKVQEEKKIF